MQTPFEKLKTDWLSERYGIQLIAARNYDEVPEEALRLVVQYDEEPPRRKYLYERRLRDLNDRYPEMPELYARLYDLYLEIGKDKYADQIVRRMMKKIPEGYRTVTYRLLNEDSRDGQKGLRSSLGPEAEITHYPPDEAAGYDYYGFINFEHAVVHHLAVTGDVYRAKKRLERLIALGLEDEDLRPYAENIMEHESVGLWGSRKWYATYEIKVAATEPVRLPYAWEEPPLRLPESKIFIDPEAENLTPEIAKELLVLPREDLIADLYTVVRDPIVRRAVILEEPNWWRTENVMTAFVMLWELGETGALADLLNLIRMDEEWHEAFFSLETAEYLSVPLLLFGKAHLSVLAEFCLEPRVEGHGRSAVVATLAQVALHDPAQEEAVVGHFERIFLALLEAGEADGLIDTGFVTNAALAYGYLRNDRLLPLLRRLEDRHWIDPSVFGGLYDLEFKLGQARDPLDVIALPDDLLDYLDGDYKDRHRQRALSSSGRIPFGQRPKAVVTAYLRKVNLSRYAAPVAAAPKAVTQPGKKVGRNAPCPCGSGRKFKRCCGKG